jgi:hypothetical protein
MHFLTDPFTTTQVNGLITPLTQASSGGSCYNETFTPLEEMQLQCLDSTYPFPEQAGYAACWPPQNNPAQQHPATQNSTYRGTYMVDQQTPFTYASAPDVYTGTAPPTPEFPPASSYPLGNEEKPQAINEANDEVLVGMGLYDAPASPNPTGLLGTQITLPHRPSAGKGLKLEETFQPSIEENSDDDDGSNDDGSNDDEPESTEETKLLDLASSHQAMQLQDPGTNPFNTRLADQSFFFDNDSEDETHLQQIYDQHFTTPVWTDVYSGAPCRWI